MLNRDLAKRERDPSFPLPPALLGSHSLKAWGYRLGIHKGTFGETTDWSTYTPEMGTYCHQDTLVTVALWNLLSTKEGLGDLSMEFAFGRLMSQQELHGVCFDERKAGDLYATLATRRAELVERCRTVFPGWYHEGKKPECYFLRLPDGTVESHGSKGDAEKARKAKGLRPTEVTITPGPLRKSHTPFNLGSRDHIARALTERYAWVPTDYTETGKPKIDDEILGALDYPEAKLIAEYLMVEKRIGQLAEGDNAWLKLCRKGRIHGQINTCGAVTGRCTHSNPNMAQVPANRAPYGKDCRSLFGPPPGYVQVGADASGLELRCFAHFLARWDGGAYAKVILEGDVHTHNQHAAGLDSRDKAKTFIYLTLYSGGPTALASQLGVSPSKASKIQANFKRSVPAYPKLVQAVQAAATRGYLIGLDGRHLHVRSSHAALNTLLQSAGALVMKKAAVILAKTSRHLDRHFMLNVHDEFQAAVRPDQAEAFGRLAVESIKAAGEFFGFRCPLDGEFHVGRDWSECH